MSEQPILTAQQQDALDAIEARLDSAHTPEERRRIARHMGKIIQNMQLSHDVSNDPTGVWAGDEDDAEDGTSSEEPKSETVSTARRAEAPVTTIGDPDSQIYIREKPIQANESGSLQTQHTSRPRRATAPVTTIGSSEDLVFTESKTISSDESEPPRRKRRATTPRTTIDTRPSQPSLEPVSNTSETDPELSYEELRVQGADAHGPTHGEVDAQAPEDVEHIQADDDIIPERLILSFIDQSQDAEDAARLAAESRLTDELNGGKSRFRRMLRNAWKGSIAREFYILKYKRSALENIHSAQDIHALETDNYSERISSQLATIDRFNSVYSEAVHGDAGEIREEIGENSEFGSAIKDLLRQYVDGTIDSPEALREERNRLIAQLAENKNTDLVGAGKVRIDNLLGIADSIKGMVEHGKSIDDVLEGMTIYTGEARSNVRTKVDYGKVDRALERLQQSKVGSLVGPETLGIAASAALIAARAGRGSLLKATGVMMIPGINGAIFGAIRENKRVKEERTQHAREMAQGKSYESGERRDQMSETLYETVSATDLRLGLEHYFDTDDALSTPEQVQQAYEALASVEARVKMSDTNAIDLVSYSDVTRIEEERFALDIARARAKVALDSRLANLPSDYASRLGIDSDDGVDAALRQYTDIIDSINADASDKDKAFAKLKRRRVATAAAMGLWTSDIFSFATQEAAALVDPTYDGLLEHMITDNDARDSDHQTVLQATLHGENSIDRSALTVNDNGYDQYKFAGSNSVYEVSAGHAMVMNSDGSLGIRDKTGAMLIDHMAVNKDGTIPQASKDLLAEHNINITDKSGLVEKTTQEWRAQTVGDFVDNHKSQTTHITRDFWYDNDTEAPRFDKNELGLRWGGANGSGIGAHGEHIMSVASMTSDGSYHDLNYTDWSQDASHGELKLAISASKDTQNEVFMVPVRADGSIEIPKNSPASHFFETKEGRTTFTGAYAEVVEVTDNKSGGQTHVRPLATLTGDNSVLTINERVPTKVATLVPRYEITVPDEAATNSANIVESIPMPPVIPRRSLESLRPNAAVRAPRTERIGYGYGADAFDEYDELVRQPEFYHTRRQVTTPEGKRRWVEADGTPVERNVEREKTAIRTYLEKKKQDQPEYYEYIKGIAKAMPPMHDECRVTVNIPAWMEGKNIERLLREYADQRDRNGDPLDAKLFEINIIVNRKTGTAPDNSVSAIKDFVDKYKAGHNGEEPPIRFVDVEFDEPNNNVGYARMVLTDAVMIRNLERNQQAPLYIESEDADLLRVDKRTVANVISKMDKNPHLDAVRGMQGRMPEMIGDNDYLLLRRKMYDAFELMARQKKFRKPGEPGWNWFFNRTMTGGWNTAYSAEAYALIGGYRPVHVGEDLHIGQMISIMRGTQGGDTNRNLETIGTVPSRSESSPRRFIQEIIKGREAYDDFGNEDDNRQIRERAIPELLKDISSFSRVDGSNVRYFNEYVNSMYEACRHATPTRADANEMMHRLMRMSGFGKHDYHFKGDTAVVTTWDNFKHNVHQYRRDFSKVRNPERSLGIHGWKYA